MKTKIFSILLFLVWMLVFDSCKKPDDGIPDVEKRHVKTVTSFHAYYTELRTTSHYLYDDDWNLTAQIGIEDGDTIAVVQYIYTNNRLSESYGPGSNFSFDTLSYQYSGDSIFTFWHENGEEYKVSLQLINDKEKIYYIEDYQWTDGVLSVKTEHHWDGNNLSETVKTLTQSGSIVTQKFTYHSEVLNPVQGLHKGGYAQSQLFISTIETIGKPNGNQSFTVLEKEDYYPIEVRNDSYIIQYVYY